ncbi:MAG: tyrosine-type recombinase/integrase, partial [Actinomycetaceae bacterium]
MAKRPRSIDLDALTASWEISLRVERKSPETVKSYTRGVRQYTDWCRAKDRPVVLDKATVSAFTLDLLDTGREAATVRARQLAVRRFSSWLADEGEIAEDPLLGVKPPKLDSKVPEPLTDDQVRAMLKACKGTDMRDKRDE